MGFQVHRQFFNSGIMADNFLENQYEEYQARKAEREAKKKALWRKRLKAYQESLKKNPGDKE